MDVSTAALQARFGMAGVLRFEVGPGGLIRAMVTTPAAEAHVHLHGGHVTHCMPAGTAPVLFLSARSRFAPGAPIRGGVPICFPWFAARAGDPAAPAHGVARTAAWTLEAVEPGDDGGVTLAFSLSADAATRRWWPHDFGLRYTVGIGRALDLRLEVENAGPTAFTFEAALHTYLAVADVRQIAIEGLSGATYVDKVDGLRPQVEGPGLIRLTGETDRIYQGTRATCVLDDPAAGRRLIVEKTGSATTVVWNPWDAKARALADLGDDEWLRFVCIETANVHDDAVTLAPGARHGLRAAIHVESRSPRGGRLPSPA